MMTPQPTDKHVRTAILAAHHRLLTSSAHGDAVGVAAVYAEDGQLLPAYSAAIRGRTAIQAFWQGWMDMGIHALHRLPNELALLNGIANEVGGYELCGREGKLLDVGKYVLIWKQEQGLWKIYRDMWTSNLPGLR